MTLLGQSPMVVVSPHFDDAALSCGRLLTATPGSHVVTVFSGGPASAPFVTEWDARSGMFHKGDDIPAVRAAEDDEALAVAGVTGHRLGVWDEQYRDKPVRLRRFRPRAVAANQAALDDPAVTDQVVERLEQAFSDLHMPVWCVPMGLWHGDHKKTAEACLRLAERHPGTTWAMYEEVPYRLELPEQVEAALRAAKERGFELTEVGIVEEATGGTSRQAKREMVSRYRSQLICLGDDRVESCIAAPEIYWWLRPPRAAGAA